LGRDDVVLRVRAWPLELVNGEPLDPTITAEHVDDLRTQVASDLFAHFDPDHFPRTSLRALAVAAVAYRRDDGIVADRGKCRLAITENVGVPACRGVGWVNVRSAAGGHLLTEELFDGDWFIAGWTTAAKADAAHEGCARLAALFAEGPGSAAVTFVDGDRASGLGFGQDDGRPCGVTTPSVRGCSACTGAELLAAGRGEGTLAEGAVHRDAVVTRRGFGQVHVEGGGQRGDHESFTARRVASARARCDRIR
jgi:hypothetical protein